MHRARSRSLRACLTIGLAVIFALSATSLATAAKVKISSPKKNATLSRTVTFKPKLSKTLKKKVKRVEVWLGSSRLASSRRSPFKVKVDTTRLANGRYVFTLKAQVRTKGKRTRKLSRRVSVRVANVSRAGTASGNQNVDGTQFVSRPSDDGSGLVADPRIEEITDGDDADNWNLVFSDEFDGAAVDPGKWLTQRDDWTTARIDDRGQSWSKGGFPYNILEGAWYMPENNTVSGGVLRQTVKKLQSPMTAHPDWGSYEHSTGMVNTRGRFGFTYGYVEARMRVPSCSGCWPAFWMLPAGEGWPPEIDIFEFFDSASNKTPYFSSHWGSAENLSSATNIFGRPGVPYTDDWHTYGVLWTAESVQVFVDGLPGPTYTGGAVPHQDMHLIIQAAIGRGYGTENGATLETDYVRVYQQG